MGTDKLLTVPDKKGGEEMKQILTKEVGKLIYQEIPNPVPKEGEALIEVKSIGLCHSDIALIEEEIWT